MPTRRSPRRGSMQVWPRKRAKAPRARVRSWSKAKDATFLGFPGYKAGMTHLQVLDTNPNSLTKNQKIVFPVTVVECPPVKIMGVNCYTKDAYGLKLANTVLHEKLDKNLARTLRLPKKHKKLADIKVEDYHELRAVIHTQPRRIGFKKKPEIMEIGLGGSTTEQLNFIKEHWNKEINVQDVFKEGQQLDSHSVTKGKGIQGPVKRFGVMLRSHKSEKTKRGPGSLGGWTSNRSYRVAHAGQMGYHLRTEYNKWLIKIDDNAESINPKGGFMRYGNIKNPYLLIKGSLGGPAKRIITLTQAIRPNKKIPPTPPQVTYISLQAKQ